MTDFLIPPYLRISAQDTTAISNTSVDRSIFTGMASTTQRAGERRRYRLTVQNASDRASVAECAKWSSLVSKLRGSANRVWYSPADYVQRGSFPAPELLSNNTFANGTTGHSPGGDAALSVADRTLRITRTGVTGANCWTGQQVTYTQYAPHVARAFMQNPYRQSIGISASAAAGISYTFSTGAEQLSLGHGVSSTGGLITTYLDNQSSSGFSQGAYVDVPWWSVSRCILVDNGPNLLAYSDQFDNAAWTKVDVTVAANSLSSPDGTTTADTAVETTATSDHYISQSVALSSDAVDYCYGVALKPTGTARSHLWLQLTTATGSVYAYFNATSGAVGTTVIGAGWSNLRTFSVPLGNGWIAFYIIARKTSADTAATAYHGAAISDGAASYTGSASYGLAAWRATLAQSSVPVRLTQTTSSATSGTTQTGSTINVKGLPASTNGLLLEGDLVQIGSQLLPVAASLDSDAAGLGALQLAYPPRIAPADNAPVIVNTPMGRFVAVNNSNGWSSRPGVFSDYELEIEEALI